MFSKLTFSLVFVLMVALVAGPAFAQTMRLSGDLNDADGAGAETDPLAKKGFIVFEMAGDPANGINADVPVISALTGNNDFPNVNTHLAFGGTIEVVSTNKDAKLYITEIMWGEDDGSAAGQWIEVYNANDSAALEADDEVRLLFTSNVRAQRDMVSLVASGGTVTITAGVVTVAAADEDDTNNVDYTVHDRVSVVNRFGSKWAPKGQSGNSVIDRDGTAPDDAEGAVVTNLVSMYRKRSTNGGKTEYKYKDGKPDGDKFGDGTDSGQWIASVGRYNMSGAFIGTPGYVQQDAGGQVVSAKAPASLPVGSVIINEIYNGTYNGNPFQWIELHNTGSATVNVKNWELEAITPKDGDASGTIQRVFRVNNKDTNIPAGGFLVITNRDPAETILAGGVDLRDSNKFPTGASQLYVVESDSDDKWMPMNGFLLVLRNGNDKDNHEKIVDIAGNAFDKVVSDAIVTDVWPLRGWTVPGDRGNGDEQKARWGASSLEQNLGKTYGRKEQKSRANRLHKDDWNPAYGPVGGLGYDPGVDLAIAPGTPGYANNAQKANPADIMGEVVISEIMYDPGANGNLAQWIEIYNSSMTQSAILNGDWELEIRNIDTDVDSYVDAKFKFKNAVILPNQTLLLVSDRSSASDVQSNRLYNLYQEHRNELGLSARKSILLSSVGFHLELRYKTTVVDEVGNVMVDGPRRSVEWALPETGGEMRHSIVRGFGTRAFDGTADMANDGTMMSSWIVAESVGSYYGHRDDVGSPGHREGSPLPVSLSSFRPVRNAETGAVVITWVTQSELNNAGFNILRSEAKDGAFQVINVKGIIAGHGTTSEKHVYTYTDTSAKPNVVYYYQIEDVSLDGERTTLRTTHLRGNVSAGGKATTTWGDLKSQK